MRSAWSIGEVAYPHRSDLQRGMFAAGRAWERVEGVPANTLLGEVVV